MQQVSFDQNLPTNKEMKDYRQLISNLKMDTGNDFQWLLRSHTKKETTP